MRKQLRHLMFLSMIFACAFWVSNSHAQRVDVDGLTETQRAEIQLNIAKQKEDNAKKAAKAATPPPAPITVLNNLPDAPKVEKLDPWIQAGVNLGKGLAEVAKQLGVAVNDFAKTPVGILTTGVIIYKLMGKDIIHLTSGFLFITVGISIWLYLARRVLILDRVNYREEMKDIGGGKFKKLKNKEVIYGTKWKDSDGFTVLLFVGTAVIIPWVGLWVMFGS